MSRGIAVTATTRSGRTIEMTAPEHNGASRNHKLERLQEEVIGIQLKIRDLEQQRLALKKQLNGKLSTLLEVRKLLKEVKSIDSFSMGIV
jgi:predicted  nucleic acid-binding Zn-ribbon protein